MPSGITYHSSSYQGINYPSNLGFLKYFNSENHLSLCLQKDHFTNLLFLSNNLQIIDPESFQILTLRIFYQAKHL